MKLPSDDWDYEICWIDDSNIIIWSDLNMNFRSYTMLQIYNVENGNFYIFLLFFYYFYYFFLF